jgi:hypothetical protein
MTEHLFTDAPKIDERSKISNKIRKGRRKKEKIVVCSKNFYRCAGSVRICYHRMVYTLSTDHPALYANAYTINLLKPSGNFTYDQV